MNIANKLKALRQAKKRRIALPFHTRKVGGIDVEPEQYNETLAFMKKVFKSLKSKKFDIKINHWGEIILVEPERLIEVFLSVRNSPYDSQITKLKKRLEHSDYFEITEKANHKTEIAFKANRQGTKWRSVVIPSSAESYIESATKLVDYIVESVSGLCDTGRPEYHKPIDEFNNEDIICVMNYGAALHGPNSQFAHILQDRNLGLMPSFEIQKEVLITLNTYGKSFTFTLNRKSIRLFNNFFKSD